MVEEELVKLREGKVEFLAPAGYNVSGPGKREGGLFYNRQMEMNRDVCVSILNALGRRVRVLDAMAATGIRSARIAVESGVECEIDAADTSQSAVELMDRNFGSLGLENVRIHRRGAIAAMAEGSFDYIDIDPFGTPVRFIPQALMSVRSGGIIGVTATDTAMLCGSARGSGRRYLCESRRWPFMHELGIRCLIGYMVRIGASFDRAVTPVLSVFADHYFRVYVKVENGVGRAERMLGRMGYASYDAGTRERYVGQTPVSGGAGPLWTGELHSSSLLSSMKCMDWFGSRRRLEKMLGLWRDEAEAPPLFYNMDELSRLFGYSLPSLSRTIELIRGSFTACRTHFDPKGFKTDAGVGELRSLLAPASPGKGISGAA